MTTKKQQTQAEKKIDPTLPFTEIEILGKTYKMCFTFRALAKADARLREQGVASNLLRMLPNMTFETIPIVLAAGLATFHPKLTFEDVVDLIDYDTVWTIRDKMIDAWVDAFPKRTKDDAENPQKPVLS
jgi:hypothetical protein